MVARSDCRTPLTRVAKIDDVNTALVVLDSKTATYRYVLQEKGLL